MRIGKWENTTDCSAKAVELEQEYHRVQNVNPKDDHQWSHHLEILTISLTHDGRFAEARRIQEVARRSGVELWDVWFRLHRAERDWDAALKVVERTRKRDKNRAAYMAALLYLDQGLIERARPEVEVLRLAQQKGRNNRQLELNFWEVQGRLLCATGSPDEGLKLIQRAVDKMKDDFRHHAWGNGAYYMETWGLAALECGKTEVAEEAFLEALAHDAGSVRAALGLQALCERLGRSDEAKRYAALARKFWGRAEVRQFDALCDRVQRASTSIAATPKSDAVPVGTDTTGR
jgi:Tfp pilus assembly protein PilF